MAADEEVCCSYFIYCQPTSVIDPKTCEKFILNEMDQSQEQLRIFSHHNAIVNARFTFFNDTIGNVIIDNFKNNTHEIVLLL